MNGDQAVSDEKTLALKLSSELTAALTTYANHVASEIQRATGYNPGRIPRAIVATDLVKRGVIAHLQSEVAERMSRLQNAKEGPVKDKVAKEVTDLQDQIASLK
jgi:hypothetical protein